MPYYMKLEEVDYTFPETCPYCLKEKVTKNRIVNKTRTKAHFLVAKTTVTHSYNIPVCDSCSKKSFRYLIYAGLSILSFIALLFSSYYLTSNRIISESVSHGLLLGSLSLFGIFLLLKVWVYNQFGIAKAEEDWFTVIVKNKDYATNLSDINSAHLEKKWF